MAVIDDIGAPDPAKTLLSMHWDAKSARLLGELTARQSADEPSFIEPFIRPSSQPFR